MHERDYISAFVGSQILWGFLRRIIDPARRGARRDGVLYTRSQILRGGKYITYSLTTFLLMTYDLFYDPMTL
jgi:hypothetical protein